MKIASHTYMKIQGIENTQAVISIVTAKGCEIIGSLASKQASFKKQMPFWQSNLLVLGWAVLLTVRIVCLHGQSEL